MNNQTHEALKMAIGIAEKAIKHWKNNIDDLDAKQWEKIDKYEDKLYDLKEALESQEIGDAEIRQMLKDIEYYQKRVEELESQKQEYDINELIDKITPENLQEPVAWMYERDNGAAILEFADDLDFHGMKAIPLYTHPAQPLTRDWIGTALERADKDEAFRKGLIGELAQPLSDDEIRQIIAKEGIPVRTGNTAVRFARAIEKAHGIGVKDDTLEG